MDLPPSSHVPAKFDASQSFQVAEKQSYGMEGVNSDSGPDLNSFDELRSSHASSAEDMDNLQAGPSPRMRGGIFPIAKPALLPWKDAGHFGRPRSIGIPQHPALNDVAKGPVPSPVGFDDTAAAAPLTPQRQDQMARFIQQGILTPPETPREEYSKDRFPLPVAPAYDPFSPPVTPGTAVRDFSLSIPQQDNALETGSPTRKAKPLHHVRFASPHTKSVISDQEISLEDDYDSASTVSTFSEHSLSLPDTTQLSRATGTATAPVVTSLPHGEDDRKARSESELYTQYYDWRVPMVVRLACAQCLRLGLPCDRAMPSCRRCTRRAAQNDQDIMSSPGPRKPKSVAESCCVPMLMSRDAYENVRPLPIFTAFGECLANVPWDVDIAVAKAELEARRRAAYGAIVEEDEERVARMNWVFPRAGAEAMTFDGRTIEERTDGRVVLKRTEGVDGTAKPRTWTDRRPLYEYTAPYSAHLRQAMSSWNEEVVAHTPPELQGRN